MPAEARVRGAVLALRPQARAVGEHGLEQIEIAAAHVDALVSHQSSQLLPDALPHDAGLTMLHREAFFVQNRHRVN